jgi:hypothetical protein
MPVMVPLPRQTPFPRGSAEETRYLQGFVEGYADAIRMRFS